MMIKNRREETEKRIGFTQGLSLPSKTVRGGFIPFIIRGSRISPAPMRRNNKKKIRISAVNTVKREISATACSDACAASRVQTIRHG